MAPIKIVVDNIELKKFKYTITSIPCTVINKCYVNINGYITECESAAQIAYHGEQNYCYDCVEFMLKKALEKIHKIKQEVF
jgi:hypothetical protein